MPLLHWLTRDQDLTAADPVPFRLLDAVPEEGFGEPSDNLLVQGDNLEALKALLPFYAAQVKCIYIDPPYNTRSAFEDYDDSLGHAQWLAMIVPRLQLLREFLREDGSMWVSINDNEAHYLKVVMDEVFGRRNFLASVIWQKIHARNNTARHFSDDHDFKLVCVNPRKAGFRTRLQERPRAIPNSGIQTTIRGGAGDALISRHRSRTAMDTMTSLARSVMCSLRVQTDIGLCLAIHLRSQEKMRIPETKWPAETVG